MTPKEMAEDLIKKYKSVELDDFQQNEMGLFVSYDDAKKLAMICVNTFIYVEPLSKYWEKVKEELNAL